MTNEEENLINQCSGDTKVATEKTKYGYKNIYQIGDRMVVLEFLQYANGEDDYDDELARVSYV